MSDAEDGTIDDLKAADAKELHRAVREEGEGELDRHTSSLLWSGLAAGLAINASLITEGAIRTVTAATRWQHLVVSLGYPAGFMLVILGRMQFFTESTITATLPLVTRPSWSIAWRTLRLWSLVLLANVAGTAVATLAMARLPLTDPSVYHGMVDVAADILKHDIGSTFWTAVPAGFLIAGLAWMLPNAREQSFLVIFAIAYSVGAAGFSHSVVGSAEAFTLVWAGRLDWTSAVLASIMPAVAGNLVGGAGLFALLAHGQVRGDMDEQRE